MDLYDAIFYRKTIKKYSNKVVKPELIKEIKEVCSNVNCLNKDLDIKAHVIERGHLVQFLMKKENIVKAPHYIILTSNKGEDYLQNIGFSMEHIVLQLTTLGVGVSWIDCNAPMSDVREIIQSDSQSFQIYYKNEFELNENEDVELETEENEFPQIILAFGYPQEKEHIFRNIDSKPNRKRIKDISKKMDKNWIKVLNAVILAPSIKNIQPWRFYNSKGVVNIYEEKSKKSLYKMSKISMGICLKHFDIACKKFDIKVSYQKLKPQKKFKKEYYISVLSKE